MSDLAALAREILDANAYMTLGTADASGRPWVSPVYFASVDYTSFHWVSSPDATHSRNISARPEVSIVIFDSRVPIGAGQAVYIAGTAEELAGAELERGIETFSEVSQGHGARPVDPRGRPATGSASPLPRHRERAFDARSRRQRRRPPHPGAPRVTPLEVETPHGPARVHLHPAGKARAVLVLGHGAGGGVEARDLAAATEAAQAERISVALVEQPYRVAGRRAPAPPHQLDAAWTAVVDHLRAGELENLPLVVGGRSLGARVACRTAEATGAIAVLCLAFPVHPPGRPEKSRLEELDAVTLPTLVVQGERDPFGMPPPGPHREIAQVSGDHGLKADLDAVTAAVRDWLRRTVA